MPTTVPTSPYETCSVDSQSSVMQQLPGACGCTSTVEPWYMSCFFTQQGRQRGRVAVRSTWYLMPAPPSHRSTIDVQYRRHSIVARMLSFEPPRPLPRPCVRVLGLSAEHDADDAVLFPSNVFLQN